MSEEEADNLDVRHDNVVVAAADNILCPAVVAEVVDNLDTRHDNAAEGAADNLDTCPDDAVVVEEADRICDYVPIPYDRDVHFRFRDRECICL